MDVERAKERLSELKRLINYHNYRYYVLDAPEITDNEFDILMKELEELENRYPEFITPDSPTQRVGAKPLEKFNSVKHTIPMLSLSNAFEEEEVVEFDKRIKRTLGISGNISYVVEPKLDGLAVELVYEDGIFVLGSTRGDGIWGEDVTLNLKTIKSVPLMLLNLTDKPIPKRIEVRGEVIINKEDFKKLNEKREKEGIPPFANPRNAASGSIRQLDSNITSERPLDIFFYGIGEVEYIEFSSHWEILETLKGFGFKVNRENALCSNIEEVIQYHEKIRENREELPYEIDGIVIKVDSLEYQKILGEKSRSPRWALAYKFEGIQATTVIEDIAVQVGRTGALTPVAIMKPVKVGGVVVNRATLHNEDEIRKKGIMIGDTVVVQRAGDVIPEVVRVIPSLRKGTERRFKFPDKCPACGSNIFKSEDEAAYRCIGLSCPAKLKESILHFASKRAMNIDGLGDKIIDQLVDKEIVKDIKDIYYLRKEDLLKLERMGDKLAQNILDSIENSKNITLDRFIYALGIRHVGEYMARLLVKEFKSFDRIMNASYEELANIKGVGPQVAQSVVSFFRDRGNIEIIEALKRANLNISEEAEEEEKSLSDKTFVLTGALKSFTREEAKRIIEKLGGRVASSVSKKTDYLIVGENPGSKLDEALKHGIKTLNEEEFKELISGKG
jgi:DNA ligase (NAD+)